MVGYIVVLGNEVIAETVDSLSEARKELEHLFGRLGARHGVMMDTNGKQWAITWELSETGYEWVARLIEEE